jgi:hypothetical protein
MTFEEKVDNLVDTLGCSIKEAEEIVRADEKIDKGEKLFEQTADQKQASKKYRQGSGKAPTVYKLDKRVRKADEDKRKLVDLLASALGMVTENAPTITNAERQIDFEYQGRKFRVVLSAPRS